ncbi:MAG: HEAT repeat domain-containing protein [Rhodothermales bacterium]|nr:HEAT repeat domain-containing protein [Rhodothermales bacterium]
MKRLLACVVFTCVGSVASLGQVRHADGTPLTDMVSQAVSMASELEATRIWAGYGLTRTMPSNTHFGWHGHDGATLGSLLRPQGSDAEQGGDAEFAIRDAARRALSDAQNVGTLVTKEFGVLFRIDVGETGPEAIDEVRLVTFDATPGLDGLPLLWLGSRSQDASLDFLLGLDSTTHGTVREDLVGAIGSHDAPAGVIPFLARLVESDPEEDVRETAGQWLAARVADAMGLQRPGRRTDAEEIRRSALYALTNSDTADATGLLLRVLETSDDSSLKRAALMQLAHVDDGGGLPALVQLAREYGR